MSNTIDTKIINLCRKQNPDAQKFVYNTLAPAMLGVCVRYLKDITIAEDVMQESFMTIFTKIDQFTGAGSFEGWVRRIMVNSALIFLRQNKIIEYSFDDIQESDIIENDSDEPEVNYQDAESTILNAEFSKDEIMEAVGQLSNGFREIFNLYAVEGYKHKEIADLLGISIGTSKSQLMRARARIRDVLYETALQKHKQKNQNIF